MKRVAPLAETARSPLSTVDRVKVDMLSSGQAEADGAEDDDRLLVDMVALGAAEIDMVLVRIE